MSDASQDFTPKLSLPYLLPSQAQKHVTVNETLTVVDALLMGAIKSAGLNAPPLERSAGDAFLIAGEPSGEWESRSGKLAVWVDDAWMFFEPNPGWRLWNIEQEHLTLFDGAEWNEISGGAADFQNIAQLGVGTSADANNPLSVRGPGALFTALETSEGGSGDIRVSVNAEDAGHTASIIFQSAFSGRSEVGLTTAGNFAVRTSPDGSNWSDALTIDPATNNVGIGTDPSPTDTLTVACPARIAGPNFTFSLNDNGAIDMYNNAGGIYLRGRSPGRFLFFGATLSNGTLINDTFYVRPDTQDVTFRFHIMPAASNATDIGSIQRSFRNLYLTNAPVVSSDKREKKNIETFDAGLSLIQALNPVTFERDSAPNVRHVGLIAQQVKEALEDQGLSNTNIWQLADPDDEQSAQAVCYSELIPVLIDAVNELAERVEDLEAQNR